MIELQRPGKLVLPAESLAFGRIEMSRYSLAGETLIKFCLWPPGEAAAGGAEHLASRLGEEAPPIMLLARPSTVLPSTDGSGESISFMTFDGQVAEIKVYPPDAALVAQRLEALLGSPTYAPREPNPPPGL